MRGRITQVTLFRHGIGCFRRGVQVSGPARVELSFPPAAMDAILKSLTVEDRGGGYLAAMTFEGPEGDSPRRQVVLDLRGEGAREAVISYAHGVPSWRMSYRLLVDTSARTVTVQGFGLVHNTTDEDWLEVALSLVVGRPLALQRELYAPLSGAEAPGPTFAAGGAPDNPQATLHRLRREGSAARRDMSMTFVVESEPRGAEQEPPLRYDVATPVSIPAGRSALVPLLRRTLPGCGLVGLMVEGARGGHPLLALQLRNDTHLSLEAGPATVYLDGAWAGEAMVEATRPGEERLVPFAVESGCRVEVEFGTLPEREQALTPGSGYLFHTTRSRDVTTWTVRAGHVPIDRLYIDHPADRHAEFIDAPEPVARLGEADRFEVRVQPEGRTSLTLTQRRSQTETLWVTPEQVQEHLALARRLSADPAVVEILAALVDIAATIGAHRGERAQLDESCNRLARQIARSRKTLETLSADASDPRERERRAAALATLVDDEEKLRAEQEQRHVADRLVQEHKRRFRDEAVRWLGEA